MPLERLPWFRFHTVDWRGDTKIRQCSLAARGLWIDLLAIMHEADPYGHLVVNGEPLTCEDVAQVVGSKARDVKKALDELLARDVVKVTATGVLFSKRMVDDRQRHDEMSARGVRGGNPILGRGRMPKDDRLDRESEQQLNQQLNQDLVSEQLNQQPNQQLNPQLKPYVRDTRERALVSGISDLASSGSGSGSGMVAAAGSGRGPLRRHPLDVVDGVAPTLVLCERASAWLERFAVALERATNVPSPRRVDRDFTPAKTLVATYSDGQLDALVETYLVATGPKFDGQPKSPGRLLDAAGMIAAQLRKAGLWPAGA